MPLCSVLPVVDGRPEGLLATHVFFAFRSASSQGEGRGHCRRATTQTDCR